MSIPKKNIPFVVSISILFTLFMFLSCDGGGSDTSTGFGQGKGYSINLIVTDDTIPQGGQTVIIVKIMDENGEPTNITVNLTSRFGNTITPATVSNSGDSVTYTASTDNVGEDRVTAAGGGAYAWVPIYIYEE